MENGFLEIIQKNKNSSNEYSLLLLQYFSIKKDIAFKKNDLELFLEKKEVDNLTVKQTEDSIKNLRKLKEQLEKERQNYSKWIYLNTKKNILEAKLNQHNLHEDQKKSTNFALGELLDKIANFNIKIFNLIDITSQEEFIDLLGKTEPIFLKIYRNKKSFYDLDFILEINDTDFTNQKNANDITMSFINDSIINMQEEILQELFISLLEKTQKGFLSPQKKPLRFLSLLKQITNIELKAVSTLVRGV